MKSRPEIAVIGLKGLPAFGGAAVVGENIIDQLKDKYDFTILSISSHTSLKTGNFNGIKQIVFKKITNGGFNTFIYYLRCLFHCLFHKYDLIHLHHAESGFITPLLRLKNKVVVTFHGVFRSNDPKFSGYHNRFFRFSEKLNIKYANEVISVSEPDKEYVSKTYGRGIKYIPNGISVGPEDLVFKETKDYILFAAGRIYEIKGLHLLLKAVKALNQNIRILIAGDLDQVRGYKREIVKLSEGLDTEFLGLIKNKPELFKLIREAKFFVFPSLTEAMSMMLLEVVSLGTPVIASDIPPNKAVFSSNELIFFRNNDVYDLAEKLNYAIGNNDVMKLMALKAQERLKREYAWNGIGKAYENIYNNLLGF
jgi:glycosyltransferase involved in cell wall biosynthesis